MAKNDVSIIEKTIQLSRRQLVQITFVTCSSKCMKKLINKNLI